MKKLFSGVLLTLVILQTFQLQAQSDYVLLYDSPAEKWVEALPVGNGRIGAMVYGGVEEDRIQFNEETLWTGKPHDYSHKGAYIYLDEIRSLLFEGKQKEAESLSAKEFMSEPLRQMAYQPFGDLIIDFHGHSNYNNYRRILDIDNAIVLTAYTVDGVEYSREYFISYPDNVMVVRIEADQEDALNFNLALNSPHFLKSLDTDGAKQTLTVRVSEDAMNGQAAVKVFTDGTINTGYDKINVSAASSATIYLSAYTNFKNYGDISENPQWLINQFLNSCSSFSYEEVKKKHILDYRTLFGRFNLGFGQDLRSDVTTPKRIYDFWKDSDDPGLIALYVQYARYLMISSSRPGGQPANLQGIWNKELKPPWDSKWTTNINTEMNYWPVELTNLSECHQPLFGMIKDLSETGSLVAREHYDCDGWVFHHNSDIWRGSAPINASNHGIWVTGGAWLCTHIWEHYLFTRDKEFLEKEYPLMRDAALFFTQFLIEDPVSGYLISTPSNSPENGGLVAGPTMDHQIIRALFNACIEASVILDTDHDFAGELRQLVAKVAPNQIGRHGQLQEWLEDKDNPDNKHRHVSHLWAVHPGKEINREDTPDLMKAARQSLEFRGDEGTGWSLGWKINLWSRFRDGNRTYKLINMLLSPAEEPQRKIRGGSYPNLFDAHPPFQIDGNFGGAAGIVEMLIQSHLGSIDILPALPDALPEGHISGVRARGGFELSFAWSGGKLAGLKVKSLAGEHCSLRYVDRHIEFETESGKSYELTSKLKLK